MLAAVSSLSKTKATDKNNFILQNSSYSGRIDTFWKGIYHPNLMLVAGIGVNINMYCGFGYFNTFIIQDIPVDLKIYILCLDLKNKSASPQYLKYMPINIAASTQLFGFHIGASIGASLNKKIMLTAFILFPVTDYLDISVHFHALDRQEMEFYSKDPISKSNLLQLKKDYQKIVKDFPAYYLKHASQSSSLDLVIKDLVVDAKNKICYLDKVLAGDREASLSSSSALIFGRSGSGKTYIATMLKCFIKENNLDSISFMESSVVSVTPTGYYGTDADKLIISLLNEQFKEGKSRVAVSLGYMLWDEFDTLRNTNRGDNFKGNAQKEFLEALEGKKVFSTDKGEIILGGIFRFSAGAFESEQDTMEHATDYYLIKHMNGLFATGIDQLANSLTNHEYFDIDKSTSFIELKNSLYEFGTALFNHLKATAYLADNNDTEKKKKHPFIALLESDNRDNFGSISRLLEGCLNHLNFAKLSENIELKNRARNVSANVLDFINIMGGKDQIESKLDTLDSQYFLSIKNLYDNFFSTENEADSIDEFMNIFWNAGRLYRKENATTLVKNAGLGAEIERRIRNILYIERPDHERALNYLKVELKKSLVSFSHSEIDNYALSLLGPKKRSLYPFKNLDNLLSLAKNKYNKISSPMLYKLEDGSYDIFSSGSRSKIATDKSLLKTLRHKVNEYIVSFRQNNTDYEELITKFDKKDVLNEEDNKEIQEIIDKITHLINKPKLDELKKAQNNYKNTFLKDFGKQGLEELIKEFYETDSLSAENIQKLEEIIKEINEEINKDKQN